MTVSDLKLGQVVIRNEAFELDLKINDGYQKYSEELLRLALLLAAGLGAVWLKLYTGTVTVLGHRLWTELSFTASFLSICGAAGAALVHRYVAADSLAYHLTALRRRERNRPEGVAGPSDVSLAKGQELKRDRRFLWSGRLLRISVGSLAAGLIFFCVCMLSLMVT